MREVPYGKRASQALVFKSMGQFDTDSQGIGAQSSESSDADDSSKNLIRARCEGRLGTSVLSPLGVVSCDLSA